jgi:hypothetical protein
MIGTNDLIPDPIEPERGAIAPDGELWGGVHFMPLAPDSVRAPTLAEFKDNATFIGYAPPDAFKTPSD